MNAGGCSPAFLRVARGYGCDVQAWCVAARLAPPLVEMPVAGSKRLVVLAAASIMIRAGWRGSLSIAWMRGWLSPEWNRQARAWR